jgi:hypothetical protein
MERKFITRNFTARSFLIGQRNFILEIFIVRGVLIDQRNFILEIFIVRGVLIGRRNFIWINNFVRLRKAPLSYLVRERHTSSAREELERDCAP